MRLKAVKTLVSGKYVILPWVGALMQSTAQNANRQVKNIEPPPLQVVITLSDTRSLSTKFF